jgi:hypothetical protein
VNVFEHHRARNTFQEWSTADCKTFFPSFSNNLVVTPDITYQNKEGFSDYKGKTLMLVGGGPSANNDWDSREYDYLWSINHFFKNEKLKNMQVHLAMIMGEPDITSEDFLSYRDLHQTYVGFEIHDRWLQHSFDNYSNYFCMHTRFYGRLGAGARMKIFAAQLGFDKVLFTGFDGPEAIFDGDHAFEPGKTTLPGVFQNLRVDNVSYFWKNQYDYLWEYLHTLYPNTKFVNIGGGEKYHEKA